MQDHLVEFYESDNLLVESVCDFLSPNLQNGEPVVLIATLAHRAAFIQALENREHDIGAARRNNLLVDLDAAETLGRLLVDGCPDPGLFEQVVGGLVQSIGHGNASLRIYGAMVALLWDQGNQAGALQLESLWNNLSTQHPFTLLCAYPLASIEWPPDSAGFRDICSTHSSVRVRFAAPLTRPEAVEPPSGTADQFTRLQGMGSDLTALKKVIRNANQMGQMAESTKIFSAGTEAIAHELTQ